MDEPLRCSRCGDVIGVYEPLVTLSEEHALETSLAAGAVRDERDARCYHRDCYVSRPRADCFGG